MSTGKPKVALDLVVFMVVVALAVLLRVYLSQQNLYPEVDGVFYMEQARHLVAHAELPFSTFPPGWPLLMTPPLLVLGLDDPLAPLQAARVANLIFGIAFPLLAYLMLRRHIGRVMALVGTGLLFFMPLNIYLTKGELSEMSYGCALLMAFLFWDRQRLVPAGLTLGYAYLIRPEAILTCAGVIVFQTVRTRRIPWRLLCGTLICIIPYVLFIRFETGHFSLSGKDVFLARAMSEYHGLGMLKLLGKNLTTLMPMLPRLIGYPLALLAVLGALIRPGRWLLFLLPLAVMPFFSFAMAPRFWVPYVPFIFLLAGSGIQWLMSRWPMVRRPRALVITILVIAGFAANSIRKDLHLVLYSQEAFFGLKAAGLWLRPQVDRDTKIGSYKPYPSFWAWCRFEKVDKDLEVVQAIDELRGRGAEYLVVHARIARSLCPTLVPLLHQPLPKSLQARLELVNAFKYKWAPLHDTYVYRIIGPTGV